jgi:hypothetical protein
MRSDRSASFRRHSHPAVRSVMLARWLRWGSDARFVGPNASNDHVDDRPRPAGAKVTDLISAREA